ncbi:MAG: alanyl-tRNA editing protein [Oscillospiraceae bacterium]|nr:alanyl-tRNA editing protein [Oscillospiraceae bacterium]
MMTRKIYYDNPFLWEFTARVLSCEAVKGGYAVVLDETAFYPEGGGQPADHGTLGAVNVLDVHEKDGVITHLCDGAIAPDATVRGAIDWARRFDHMQQHSGEHICSGLICARFGCDNVGFHMGADAVTIDFNAEIDWDALLEIEAKANQYIYEDHAIDIQFHRGAALDAIDYRSKKPLDGDVRIVTFPGADCCACCGTHVARSGQVGIVKFLSCQKFREGVRIELLCGARAYRYLSAAWGQNLQIAQSLSAKPLESAAAVARLESELGTLKQRAAKLEAQVFAQVASRLAGEGDVLLFEEDMAPDSVRKLCDAVTQVCGGRCAVFAGADGAWKYAIGQRDGDVRELVKALNAALRGRGGGKPGFAQGSCAAAKSEIEGFFQTI